MKKRVAAGVLLVLTVMFTAAFKLKMPSPPQIEVQGATPWALTAGLFVPKELRDYTYAVKTSPFDKMVYPLGEQIAGLFEKNLPAAFKSVVAAASHVPAQGVDLVVEPSIVKFEAVVPHPAYNPYTATIVLRIEVYDHQGNKIFTQTATGNGQTSKGMVSGFKAQSLAAEAAQMAMADAGKQILEALLAAPEIKEYR